MSRVQSIRSKRGGLSSKRPRSHTFNVLYPASKSNEQCPLSSTMAYNSFMDGLLRGNSSLDISTCRNLLPKLAQRSRQWAKSIEAQHIKTLTCIETLQAFAATLLDTASLQGLCFTLIEYSMGNKADDERAITKPPPIKAKEEQPIIMAEQPIIMTEKPIIMAEQSITMAEQPIKSLNEELESADSNFNEQQIVPEFRKKKREEPVSECDTSRSVSRTSDFISARLPSEQPISNAIVHCCKTSQQAIFSPQIDLDILLCPGGDISRNREQSSSWLRRIRKTVATGMKQPTKDIDLRPYWMICSDPAINTLLRNPNSIAIVQWNILGFSKVTN